MAAIENHTGGLLKAYTDYALQPDMASLLYGIATLPADMRREAMTAIRHKYGGPVLDDLFAQFIGLASSVAANAQEHAEQLLIEFGAHPYTAEKINMPNILGALNGLHLVEGVDTALICHGCAYRLGSVANQCLPTTMDADMCTQPGEVAFMCHAEMDVSGNPLKGCRGFAQRRAAMNAAANK